MKESPAQEPASIFKEILSVPFGSLPKSELEHLIFKHLVNERVVKLEDGIFALAMQLRASPSKIRNLVFTHDQRLSANQYLSDIEGELGLPLDLEEILKSTRYELKDDFHIAFAVENPLQKMKIERLVRRTGFLADGSFSKEVIVLGNKAFVSLLEQFDLLKDKKIKSNIYADLSPESLKVLSGRTQRIINASPGILKQAASQTMGDTVFALAQATMRLVGSL